MTSVMGYGFQGQGQFFNPRGSLVIFQVHQRQLTRHSEHPIGRRAQGAAFSHDGAVLIVHNTVERRSRIFPVSQQGLADSGETRAIAFGSFAAIRTQDFPAPPA